jgi:Kef-type K+ transport system membrane component KefB
MEDKLTRTIVKWFDKNIKLHNLIYFFIGIILLTFSCFTREWIENNALFYATWFSISSISCVFLVLSKYANNAYNEQKS